MRLVSWNVNGIHSCVKAGLLDFLRQEQADLYCFQEIKTSPHKISLPLAHVAGYTPYWHFAEQNGYSGIVVYTRHRPLSVQKGLGSEEFDREGRVITLEFPSIYVVAAYFPHAGRECERLPFKLRFNAAIQDHCDQLRQKKSVAIGGDFNVAHTEKDVARAQEKEGEAGFTVQERQWFSRFLDSGYVDTFRQFTHEGGHYTFWSNVRHSRERNKGWRIDYWLASAELQSAVSQADILAQVPGSDHCPVGVTLDPTDTQDTKH